MPFEDQPMIRDEIVASLQQTLRRTTEGEWQIEDVRQLAFACLVDKTIIDRLMTLVSELKRDSTIELAASVLRAAVVRND